MRPNKFLPYLIQPIFLDRLEELLKQCKPSKSNRILVFALYKKEAARVQEVSAPPPFARVAALPRALSQPVHAVSGCDRMPHAA